MIRYYIDYDFNCPFVVGNGNILHLQGWCFHPQETIKGLSVLVNTTCYPVSQHSLPRLDILQTLYPTCYETPEAAEFPNSLTSSFWLQIPFKAIDQPESVVVALEVHLSGNVQYHEVIGTIQLLPGNTAPASDTFDTKSAHNSQPLIAICMATYNPNLEWLREQIESIRQQHYTNWECIINDDHSYVETYQQIQLLLGDDKRFCIYRNQEQLGVYRNFEKCLSHVPNDAEFVALSDQDDIWFPDKLTSLLSSFTEDTTLAFGDMHVVAEDGQLIFETFWKGRRNNFTNLEILLFTNTITGAASLFRRRLLSDILPFPQALPGAYHDHWIGCIALSVGSIAYVDRPLHAYRQHGYNVIGYKHWKAARLLPGLKTLLRWALSSTKRRLASLPLIEMAKYYGWFLRIILWCAVLCQRLPDIPHEKYAILKRFSRIDWAIPHLLLMVLRYRTARNITLGHELRSLQAVLAHHLLTTFCQQHRDKILRGRTDLLIKG